MLKPNHVIQQKDEDGAPLIKLGALGASVLNSDEYENIYRLHLKVCCKNE